MKYYQLMILLVLLIALTSCSSAKFNQRWDYTLNQALDNPNAKIIIINNDKQLQIYDKNYNLITEIKK